jgi:hypothetical protein
VRITAPRKGDLNESRCVALKQLVEAAAIRPFDASKVEAARKSLLATEGEATLVEALAVNGSIDLFTKLMDGTGRTAMPDFMMRII